MINELKILRACLLFFIIMLFLSGATAIPINMELSLLIKISPPGNLFSQWLQKVLSAYRNINGQYPFLLYGYDWLAFAHFILAILFIGPYRNPIQNVWVIEFGMIACVLIIPFALIAGHFRHIPFGWQLIDCSFGVFGFITLWIFHKKIKIVIHKNNQINNHANICAKYMDEKQITD
jgi:hypothetical protein